MIARVHVHACVRVCFVCVCARGVCVCVCARARGVCAGGLESAGASGRGPSE